MKKQLFLLLFLLNTLSFALVQAQPTVQPVQVQIVPQKSNWNYETGESVTFDIAVLQSGHPLSNVEISYQVGPERMEPTKKETVLLKTGTLSVKGTMNNPGFLRCLVYAKVQGKQYKGLATVAVSAARIQPTIAMPADFDAFWKSNLDELKKVPLDSRMTLLPEKCTELVNVYHVNFRNINNARVYGILCVPKKEGKYPALLHVPGAGVRPYSGDIATAEKGIITLQIGIHGIPVTMDPQVYTDLGSGALQGYFFNNLDDRDRYVYKRIYLGCVRANDFIFSLPQFDGIRLGVTGGSQGGALSITTAALDARVKYLAAMYPALCDATGYLNGRAGGWPHFLDKNNGPFMNKPDKIKTMGYYDVVNFGRKVSIPGFYAWGYNDETCPPTSMHAAYNAITADKELAIWPETGHWAYPEEREQVMNWIIQKLQSPVR